MKSIFSILLILISGLLFFFFVRPIYSEVSELRTEVATYNIALDNSTELQKTRDQLVDTYKNISSADRARLEHFLPNTVNNIKFILEIERIANLHSMPIKNIRFENPQTAAPKTGPTGNTIMASDPSANLPYGSFPIEFTTEGDYDTFVLFLKDIEHNLRLVDVKSVSFNSPTSDKAAIGANPNVYSFNLKVETYWLK